ncbi:uncharacterized protein LOC144917259 [Branchiostoma floridae x Branchiostoma belcheri]
MLSRPVLITAVGISCLLFLYTVTRTGHIPGTVEPPIPGAQTDSLKHVLVTGAAGFVGFHLSKALLDKPHARVFGVDNFDKWSDLKLKQDRAHELYEYGVALEDGDICDQEYLTDLFRRENFTHMVHLAGRSGVRGQDLDAAAIMENNVECFVNLLEVMKNYKNIKLVYASSASVYGSSSQLPFSPSHHVLQPDTIEGLAKRTGELLAQGYCKEYGLHQVGLRFFTVYGPWGREDSALNIFTQQMLEGEVLQVFHTREGRPLERDFLYVEDAVRGVLSALDFSPTHCGHVFNLASGQAQSAVDLVALLEQQLNIQAQAVKVLAPPLEVVRMVGDVQCSLQQLGFKPKVSLHQGVQDFVQWALKYREQQHRNQKSKQASLSQKFRERLLSERNEREERLQSEALARRNEELRTMVQQQRDVFLKYAMKNNIPLPDMTRGPFHFYQGVDSPGGDIIKAISLKNNPEAMKKRCLEAEQCVAFSSAGMLKSRVKPPHLWQQAAFSSPEQGIYVADVDMCAADLHDCDEHAFCNKTGPAQFRCTCRDGYYGNGQTCLPRYNPDEPLPLEVRRDSLISVFNGINLQDMKTAAQFVFFQGMDSLGGDFMVAEQFRGQPKQLQSICLDIPQCIGFNSNGMLKMSMSRPSGWIRWSNKDSDGLYLLDLNYCELDLELCPEGSLCQRHAPGVYQCTCQTPLVMVNNQCVQVPGYGNMSVAVYPGREVEVGGYM